MSTIFGFNKASNSVLDYILLGRRVVKPALADGWTWFNQGNATISESSRGISLSSPGDPNFNVMGVYLPYPQPPFILTALVVYDVILNAQYAGGGVGIRESSTQKGQWLELTLGTQQFEIIRSTNDTTWNSTPVNKKWAAGYPMFWVRIEDDGTQLTWKYSFTGTSWITLYTHLRTDYLVPDQVTFVISPESSENIQVTLASFEIE